LQRRLGAVAVRSAKGVDARDAMGCGSGWGGWRLRRRSIVFSNTPFDHGPVVSPRRRLRFFLFPLHSLVSSPINSKSIPAKTFSASPPLTITNRRLRLPHHHYSNSAIPRPLSYTSPNPVSSSPPPSPLAYTVSTWRMVSTGVLVFLPSLGLISS